MAKQPGGQSLGALLGVLSERGEAPAILALREDDLERWSAQELARTAARLALGLSRAGIAKGDHVAIFAGNRPQWIAACLGVLAAGGVAMPLDVQFGDEPLEHALKDGAPKLIFTDRARAKRLDKARSRAQRAFLDEEKGADGWRALLEDKGELPYLEPRDYAALFYTSGTTGPPKGVPLTHGNLASQLTSLRESAVVGEGDRALLPLPLHHVYPFVLGMLVPLELGVPIVLPHALTGPEIARGIREGEASVVIGVPRLYAALIDSIEARAAGAGRVAHALFRMLLGLSLAFGRVKLDPGKRLFKTLHERMGASLRLLASGGAPLSGEIERTLSALGWRVAVGYGLTETSPLITLRLPGEGAPGSVGRAVPGVELRLDRDAAPGEAEEGVGEVLVKGPNVFGGYHELEEKSQSTFTADGWFRTGDLGRLDEAGHLFLVGRTSEMIVTAGGKNVQPEDVESAYLEHEALREIGVFQKGRKLAAVVVPEPKALRREKDAEALVGRALKEQAKRLPSYQRVSQFAVTREGLERTRLGKLRRHKLEARFEKAKKRKERGAGPVPIDEMAGDDQTLLENPAAKAVWDYLAERFSRVPLSPDTALELDLGVDSLEWVNLSLEISQRAGVELSEDGISKVETVRDLLATVAEAKEGEGPDLAENPEAALDERQKRWLRELPRPARALASGLYALNAVFMRAFFRLEPKDATRTEGAGEALVLAPNHTSLLDPPALAAALDRERLKSLFWGGWVGIAFGNPIARVISRLAQTVPIDPRRGPISSLAFAAALLKRGKSLVWFPEGGRSDDGKLKELKPGIAMLLEAQDVPVVPVHISGTHEALPLGRALPRRAQITVRFGRPIKRATLLREGKGDDARAKVLDALARRIESLATEN